MTTSPASTTPEAARRAAVPIDTAIAPWTVPMPKAFAPWTAIPMPCPGPTQTTVAAKRPTSTTPSNTVPVSTPPPADRNSTLATNALSPATRSIPLRASINPRPHDPAITIPAPAAGIPRARERRRTMTVMMSTMMPLVLMTVLPAVATTVVAALDTTEAPIRLLLLHRLSFSLAKMRSCVCFDRDVQLVAYGKCPFHEQSGYVKLC